MYSNVEQLLLKGCKGEHCDEEFAFVSEHHSHDIDQANLNTQWQVLATNFPGVKDASLGSVLKYFQTMSNAGRILYSEVISLVKLILVMPASNATSERSFIAVRRLKMYLRCTMSQRRLNNLMVQHVHSDRIDKMNLLEIGNGFLSANDQRKSVLVFQSLKFDILCVQFNK